ncbi:MAG: UDP-N-acetylmuramate--L-alanine ligase [Myxococcota bacterium]
MPEVSEFPTNASHVHIMGIGGTAMAALAGLLVQAGYTVTGSDANIVYPPMSEVLAKIGIKPMVGYHASNLNPAPDLVIVGNVIRAIYEEAQFLQQSSIPYMSFPSLLGAKFIGNKRSIVAAGTHGKTTTTSLLTWLLEAAEKGPGYLIGGAALNFGQPAASGHGEYFVVEGDEYDTAFFDKGPKFLHYRPHTAIVTSIEFDHADIYRDLEHCQESFRKLADIIPEDGCMVARWDDDAVVNAVSHAKGDIRRYGLNQDWDGEIIGFDSDAGQMIFRVLKSGKEWGVFQSIMAGEHNLYNQVACCAALDFYGFSPSDLQHGFRSFRGIKRRQECIGEAFDVSVIDDFAHHPTAVRLTLGGLRLRFGERRIWAIFEPRSATARRKTHQDEYADSFSDADLVVIAPPYDQSRIPKAERMNADELVAQINATGTEAYLWGNNGNDADDIADQIASTVLANVQPLDVIAVMSNGGFGGLHHKLLTGLKEKETTK